MCCEEVGVRRYIRCGGEKVCLYEQLVMYLGARKNRSLNIAMTV